MVSSFKLVVPMEVQEAIPYLFATEEDHPWFQAGTTHKVCSSDVDVDNWQMNAYLSSDGN